MGTAEESARQVLTEIWKERVFPVDPVWIARQMGLKVLDAALPSNVSGALVKKADQDPIILLNSADSDNRKRFSCAHEIGHYMNRQSGDVFEYIDLRGPSAAHGSSAEEIFANQFAAGLLMPENEVRRLRALKMLPAILAYRLGVSRGALDNRLKNLRLS